jgi:predicted pyridoxine 5'-phosphate oxidase superfamily flavin-nucleotide-binding protein
VRGGPFHVGEQRAQALAGRAPAGAGAAIRSFLIDQHRLFFEALPFVVAGVTDDDGAPLAALLTGAPGFISSPDPRTLTIASRRDDPVVARLRPGASIGLLGIALETRRRNRLNGRVTDASPGGLTVAVEQSFGNCPQYIHPRRLIVDPCPRSDDAESFDGLDAAAVRQIAAADTFFVASSSGAGVAGGGVDVSHRGGPAGFVRVEGETLTIPDYRGNRYFNTLGNLLLEPRAALLFVDFEAGRLLHVQGTAEIAWRGADLPGAERTWRFKVQRCRRGPSALRLQAAVQPPSMTKEPPVADAP